MVQAYYTGLGLIGIPGRQRFIGWPIIDWLPRHSFSKGFNLQYVAFVLGYMQCYCLSTDARLMQGKLLQSLVF